VHPPPGDSAGRRARRSPRSSASSAARPRCCSPGAPPAACSRRRTTSTSAAHLSGISRLLDVGGGSGAYDIELCRQYRNLRATVYDLPTVGDAAPAQRIDALGDDFFADPAFPPGHDAVLLSMVMHDWGEVRDRAILDKCWAALPSGGLVIISELLVNDERTGHPPAALMSLNTLIEAEGRNYTPSEYGRWLRDAGFRDIRTVWFEAPGANGAVIARKP
jgi:hypothetical protein